MPYLERLLALKEDRDLTNAEIAKLSNIPLATVTRIFIGIKRKTDEKNF